MKLRTLSFFILLLFAVGCTTRDKQAEIIWKERNIPKAVHLQVVDSLVIN